MTDFADLRTKLLGLRRWTLEKLVERLDDGTLEPGLLEVVASVQGTLAAIDEEILKMMEEKHDALDES